SRSHNSAGRHLSSLPRRNAAQVGDWSTSIYPSILTATPCMLCGGGVSMVMDAALHDWCGPLPGGSKLPIYPQIPDGFTAEELESLLLFPS
uniref:Uncharacterized protein n=1 Tax=Aegilops tauschii subsp. strangulata TaxID=200361 RepID=A0A453FWQ5_AEGTS